MTPSRALVALIALAGWVAAPAWPAGARERPLSFLVILVDLYPTIVSLAGIAPPGGLEGRSLEPLLCDPHSPGKPASRSRWLDGESLRTERFRYTAWRSSSGERTDEMLFDLEHDPAETVNVAADPAYAEAVAALRLQLDIPGAVPTWSPKLVRLSRLWRLSNSTPALVAIAYPLSSLLAILAVSIGAGVLLFRRFRRLRASR